MDNTEEIQKLVGKLVIESYLRDSQLQKQIKDLMKENSQLKELINEEKFSESTKQ